MKEWREGQEVPAQPSPAVILFQLGVDTCLLLSPAHREGNHFSGAAEAAALLLPVLKNKRASKPRFRASAPKHLYKETSPVAW